MRTALAVLLLALVGSACRTPVQVEAPAPERTDSGLEIRDLRAGSGPQVVRGSRVRLHYVGSFEDGERFDSSYDRGAPLELTVGAGEVIPGWEEGMLGMQAGGQRRIRVPPELGFDQAGSPAAGRVLVLEVELLAVDPD